MFSQTSKKSFILNGLLFQIIVAAVSGLLLGIATTHFSGLWILGILAGILLIFIILKRPEFALLGILIATSSIVFEDQLPMLSAGGISLHISDFLLLGMLGLIIVRWLVEPEFKIVRTSLDWPLLIFICVTLLSTFIAMYQNTVESEEARRWIRVLAYYLTFFIVTNLVRNRQQLNNLLNGLFILATFVASVMVAQYLLGQSVALLPGRVESLNTQGVDYAEITRILPPGLSIVIIVFVASLCSLLLEKSKPFGWLKFIPLGVLGLAVIFTFLRSYWGALIAVLVLLGFIFKGPDRQKLLNWGVWAVLGATILFLFVALIPGSKVGGLLSASGDRIGTIFKIGTYQGQDDSLNWRMIENNYAYSAIADHPLLGMGMGFTYRPWDRRLDNPRDATDFRKHIHNGHLWILLQSGLLGYLSLTWLSLIFLYRGFKYWRNISNPHFRGIVLGFTLAYLAILIAATVNSTFTQWRWTPVIGLMMGINEVILMKFNQDQSVE